MNKECKAFVDFICNSEPNDVKELEQKVFVQKFNLIQDRKVYHNNYFGVRFCYSKYSSKSVSNTVLSLSALEKYDRIPFFVVIVRKDADNLIYLANTTFLKKISHSSQKLSMTNIRGSFNVSDIIKEFNGISNTPDNFDYLFNIHQGFDWEDNLTRLVEATANIKPVSKKFIPTDEEIINLFNSVDRAIDFAKSHNFNVLLDDLNERCNKCRNEILIASHIENINIRGRLIESLIASNDNDRNKLMRSIMDLEVSLPVYDSKNGLGDYCRQFDNSNTYTDIKTKIFYLNSNPKAYNIDKFLKQMSETKSIFLFFFIRINENNDFDTLLCSVYNSKFIDNTLTQFHWSGRSTRGVTQFNGAVIDEMLDEKPFRNTIDKNKSISFLKDLLNL